MTLRAGLVGLGMIGRHHARVMRRLNGLELVGIVDPAGDPLEAAPGTPMLGSVEELIALGLDMAVVAVPTAEHEAISVTLAEAGVHVMVEKPLASTEAAARRIAAAFQTRGLVGCVGHIERFNPALQQMRRRLADGDLGEVYQIATRRQGPFPARIADVGVVKDLATHDIDLTSWVTQRDFVTVSAQVAHRSGREHEDLVAAVGLLEGGTVTSHLVNWLSPYKERVTVVTGERGALVADMLTADLTRFDNASVPSQWESLASFRGVSEGDMVRYAFPKREPLLMEHEAFRDAVLGNGADIVSMAQATRTVAVAEAMISSATVMSTTSRD